MIGEIEKHSTRKLNTTSFIERAKKVHGVVHSELREINKQFKKLKYVKT